MGDARRALIESPALRRLAPWLVYFLVAIAVSWPLVLQLDTALIGYPTIDAQDTLGLHGLVASTLLAPSDWPLGMDVYYPVGYPIFLLTPNLLDHLTAAPLVWALPFPLSDNLWWLIVLILNGWAGHRLGQRVGGSQAAGYFCGLALLLSEPVLRETNLSHAPQAMVFWAPLYLIAILDLREQQGSPKNAVFRAGIFLALSGLCYWYLAFFLVLGSLPLLLGIERKQLAWVGGISSGICAPFLLPQLLGWNTRPLTSRQVTLAPAEGITDGYATIPESDWFVTQHGAEPFWFLHGSPMDVSNQVSIILVVAALLGARRSNHRKVFGFMAILGSIMVLGPYLRWNGDLVTIGGQAVLLPFGWLMKLHPVFERLTWPERWGIIMILGLIPLAARAPRPWLWIPLMLVETPIRSANLPLQHTQMETQLCWRELSSAPGAILELPAWQMRRYQRASQIGVHQRLHGRPLWNPLLLPPGAESPTDWARFNDTEPTINALREFETGSFPNITAEMIRDLRDIGFSAIAVDAEPGGVLATRGALNRFRTLRVETLDDGRLRLPERSLSDQLGAPIDLGCALVWWLETDVPAPEAHEDGEQWRADTADWLQRNPAPELDTLIEPTWNRLRQDSESRDTR